MVGITKRDVKPLVQEFFSLGKWMLRHGVTLRDHVETGLRDAGHRNVSFPDDIAAEFDKGESKLRHLIAREDYLRDTLAKRA